jgi:hypothetical protein
MEVPLQEALFLIYREEHHRCEPMGLKESFTLKIEAICSFKMLVLTGTTCHIPEDSILQYFKMFYDYVLTIHTVVLHL